MDFVLSTSWNAFRHSDGKELIDEIKKLGFREVELSFNLTDTILQGVSALVRENQIRVASLHNFCPIPQGLRREEALPDCYSMASCNEEERKAALKFTRRTIDTASSLGAQAVVLHCGRVEMPDATRELIELYNRGEKESDKFRALREDVERKRKSQAGPFFENTLRSLEELSRYAQKLGIALGVETRFYFCEIPSFQELGIILEELKGSKVFYWHDTGHAQVREHLGFEKHKEYLQAYAARMLGIHLHDVSGCRDHLAPSRGKIDFAFLKPYLNNACLRVIEAHHPATAEDLQAAKAFLGRVLYG